MRGKIMKKGIYGVLMVLFFKFYLYLSVLIFEIKGIMHILKRVINWNSNTKKALLCYKDILKVNTGRQGWGWSCGMSLVLLLLFCRFAN